MLYKARFSPVYMSADTLCVIPIGKRGGETETDSHSSFVCVCVCVEGGGGCLFYVSRGKRKSEAVWRAGAGGAGRWGQAVEGKEVTMKGGGGGRGNSSKQVQRMYACVRV